MEIELYKRLKRIRNKINKNTMLCIKAQIKRGEFEAASKGIGKYER